MDRVSDERLESWIKFTENTEVYNEIYAALTELRDRRQAEKTAPESYDAEWVTDACPWCLKMRGSPGMVCKDKFGLRCVVEGCGWGDDLTLTQAEKTIDKAGA